MFPIQEFGDNTMFFVVNRVLVNGEETSTLPPAKLVQEIKAYMYEHRGRYQLPEISGFVFRMTLRVVSSFLVGLFSGLATIWVLQHWAQLGALVK
jgi:hypothetical protein